MSFLLFAGTKDRDIIDVLQQSFQYFPVSTTFIPPQLHKCSTQNAEFLEVDFSRKNWGQEIRKKRTKKIPGSPRLKADRDWRHWQITSLQGEASEGPREGPGERASRAP